MKKPLGRKAYGSIPHLPGSRLGSGDHKISEGQAKIATEKIRKDDWVIIQEKLDGSNVAVAKLADYRVVALGRSGYLAESSPYLQHHLFSDWVYANYERFDTLLNPGEWVSGEWLAQAHGTLYELQHEPFVAFDLWVNGKRSSHYELSTRTMGLFVNPNVLHIGGDCSIQNALDKLTPEYHGALEPIEGCVWRVERWQYEKPNSVDFLCKYVRPDKIDGKYLSEISGKPPVWNIGLEQYLPKKALDRLKRAS